MVTVWELLATRRDRIYSRALRSRVDPANVYDAVSDRLLAIESKGGWLTDPRAQSTYYSKTVSSCIISEARARTRQSAICKVTPSVPDIAVEETQAQSARESVADLLSSVGADESALVSAMLAHFGSPSGRSLPRSVATRLGITENEAYARINRLRERAKRRESSFV